MMLASEAGKEGVRIMEMERMIRLDMTTSLGLGHVENLGAAAHHVMPSWAQQLRRPPPVQLDLLPMSRSSHDSVHETSTAEPPPDSSVTDRFSSLLEQTFLSRMDSCNGECSLYAVISRRACCCSLRLESWSSLDCTLLLLTYSIADMHCPEGSLFCAGNNNADGVAVETYSSGGGRGSSPRDIDMNQLPSTSDGDDEAVVSSPSCSIGIMTSNPSITTDQRDQIKWHVNMQLFDPAELQDMRGTAGGGCDLSSRRGSDDEADGSAATTRKKLRLSKEQSALLEDSFKDHSTLNPVRKLLADHPMSPLSQSSIAAKSYCPSCSYFLHKCIIFLRMIKYIPVSSSEFWGHSTCFFVRGFNPCRSKRTPWQSSSICVLDKWRSGFKTEEPGA